MRQIEGELDRYLTLLRDKISQRGFTQNEIQDALGWGRSYISQLLTKQKALRVEQVLLILNVIGVDPAEFIAELYRLPGPLDARPGGARQDEARLAQELSHLRTLLEGLVQQLVARKVITASELGAAQSEAMAGGGADAAGSLY